jgi:hypothetical protein
MIATKVLKLNLERDGEVSESQNANERETTNYYKFEILLTTDDS